MSFEPSRRACEMTLWFILFFSAAAFGATEWWSRAVLEALIFILGAMCALRRDFTAPLRGPLLGFGFVIVLGALQLLDSHAMSDPAGILPFTLSRAQTLYALLLWAALATLLWLSTGILRWEGALMRLSWAIFSIGLFIAVVGIVQRGQGNSAYYGLRPIRQGYPFGPFTNYNHAAAWMISAALVAAGLIAAGFQRQRAALAERTAQQALAIFALVILIGAVFMTGSRGGILAMIAAMGITAHLASGSLPRAWARRFVRTGLLLSGIACVFYLIAHTKWLGYVGGEFDVSAAYRFSMYRSGMRMLKDFPVFGVGLGCFATGFEAYKELIIGDFVDHVHSSWFEVALETGLAGIVVLGTAMVKPLVAMGCRLPDPKFRGRAIATGYFSALLAFLLQGGVEFSFQIPADAVLCVVVMAGLSSQLAWKPTSRLNNARTPRIILASVFASISILSLPPGFSRAAFRLGAPFIPSK